MDISVIILNFNHKHFIKLALEALERSKFSGKFEVILVDNQSTDNISREFIIRAGKEGRAKVILNNKNIGFGRGYNAGVAEAKGKYILIHNPDAAVKADTLQKLWEFAEQNFVWKNGKKLGILAPKLVYANGEVQESCRRRMKFVDLIIKRTFLSRLPYFKKRLDNYLMRDFEHDKVAEVDLVTGAAMFIPRSIWDEVKGFDERYYLFMEDFDLCNEIRAKGHEIIYFPEAQMDHYHKRLSGGKLRQVIFKRAFWLHIASAIKYSLKWG